MQLNTRNLSGPGLPVFLGAFAALLLMFAPAPRPLHAQSLFSPAITVNDEVITNFELEQRIRFMTLLRAPGDPEERAREELIDDRLRNQAVRDAGITVTDEQVNVGIEDYAARTQLSTAAFIDALGEGGVAPETLRDFIRTSLGWRELVRGRFLNQARPSQEEVDRALSQDQSSGGVSVSLAEVIIPITPETLGQAEELARQISDIQDYATFSDAAARFSAAPTRDRGGDLGWLALNTLPPALRPTILELTPGETSAPIPLPNAIAVFQMRGIRELPVPAPRYSTIDYAAYYIPGGRSPEALATAAEIALQVDRCDDLYGIAQGQPPEVLDRESRAPGEIPQDIALELAKLDPGETSATLTRADGQTLVFLMLCGRTAAVNEAASRDDVASALTVQRLESFAESYLQQLRADALIIEQ
ncbi:peptidylprolyl isomerase [Pseudooceanicola lipolyticus]|nr:peptidylprolyl isomerase [Pseudooceanicola lipolyticus]